MPQRLPIVGELAAAPATVAREVVRLEGDGAPVARTDRVVVEEPLEIRLDGESIAVTMRTPGHDFELAVGFLFTETTLTSAADVASVGYSNRADDRAHQNVVEIVGARTLDVAHAKRSFYAASSCGLCGKATLDAIHARVAPIDDALVLDRAVLLSLPEKMRAAQATFDATGGLHAAALFDARGELLVLREDVGRHNATDKVIGERLLARALPLGGHVLMVSGRAGFEIVQKAAVARIPVVAAVSAPSSLAIDLAERLGITLVGFLRPPHASTYAHAHRIA